MSRILGSQELINGNTQQELADRWWAQTFSTPADVNPFIIDDATDPRGRRGSVERYENFQSKSPDGVSFLGGIISGAIDSPAFRTIVGRTDTVYFAPFANQVVDNTTDDFSSNSDFPGGYALTLQHLADLKAQGLNPRDPSDLLGGNPGSIPTLLDVARLIADDFNGQFVAIDGKDFTPVNIAAYRQETNNLSYNQLPRSTGAFYSPDIYVADPNLGENLNDSDPANDQFPKLSDINPSGEKAVIPFVQAGYYFAFTLNPGSHTVNFGATSNKQDVTYNILNPIEGTAQKDKLRGTNGQDYINGSGGSDKLLGLKGDDLLIGGDGADVIDGGKDNDELWGDGGPDTFIFKRNYGSDKIFDFERGDKVDIRGLCVTRNGISDVKFLSEIQAAQIDFGGGDILTFVGLKSSDLNIQRGMITL
jgi:Ca2+-binding RTX toxin-like protein